MVEKLKLILVMVASGSKWVIVTATKDKRDEILDLVPWATQGNNATIDRAQGLVTLNNGGGYLQAIVISELINGLTFDGVYFDECEEVQVDVWKEVQ